MAKSVFRTSGKGSRNRIIAEQTRAVKKNGKLKGKNKKETKIMKMRCMHHVYDKKDRVKPTVKPYKGHLICTMCKQDIVTEFYSKAYVKKSVEPVMDIVQQAKYLAVACNTSNETISFISDLSVQLGLLPKTYDRLVDLGSTQGKSKKKKKEKDEWAGSRSYGNWY